MREGQSIGFVIFLKYSSDVFPNENFLFRLELIGKISQPIGEVSIKHIYCFMFELEQGATGSMQLLATRLGWSTATLNLMLLEKNALMTTYCFAHCRKY